MSIGELELTVDMAREQFEKKLYSKKNELEIVINVFCSGYEAGIGMRRDVIFLLQPASPATSV